MTLASLREQLGFTLVDAAGQCEMTQAPVSRFERRSDHLLSPLRRHSEA